MVSENQPKRADDPAEETRPFSFSYDSFRDMARALRARAYRFAAFAGAPQLLEAGDRFILMRHDIDFDLKAALRLAQVESEEGIIATFFFLLRTDLYNLFSAEGTATVRALLGLGHHLGLHFDCAAYAGISVHELAEACAREAETLERLFDRSIEVVSYHRPNPLVLSGEPALSAPRWHTYMPLFTQAMHYLSDSQGRWRFGSPYESAAFRAGKPMHLLIHPIWWGETSLHPYERLQAYRDQKLYEIETAMARNCTVYRRNSFAHVTD